MVGDERPDSMYFIDYYVELQTSTEEECIAAAKRDGRPKTTFTRVRAIPGGDDEAVAEFRYRNRQTKGTH